MNEADVKKALYATELARLSKEDPSTRIVEEFCISGGKVRVDVSAINGQLHGYEIKSAVDNLERLPRQQKYYNQIFDRITIVADEKHVVKAMKIVPQWWGLITASSHAHGTVLEQIWPARQNYEIDASALVQLLWRDEALSILRVNGIGRGLSQKSRKYLWKVMLSCLDLPTIKSSVRNCLKYRMDWR
ncbi:MAG: sce7726 family protein [Candidatus Obscuribacterales bacterium]|nr:sce7726 family protein [Candidatus Obscuribacterales bacterium]